MLSGMRDHLQRLSQALEECGEVTCAARIKDLLSGPEHELATILTSNELWGGAGSIADQSGLTKRGQRTDRRRTVERALIQLGNEQIRSGNVNQRTARWVSVFTKWENAGI
jgi:hypothetical protein